MTLNREYIRIVHPVCANMGMLASFERQVWYVFLFYRHWSNIRKTYILRSQIVKSCLDFPLSLVEGLSAETPEFFTPGEA